MTETTDTTKLAEIVGFMTKPETTKGYWTENPTGFIDFAVISEADGPLIALSSKYWYRVQYFKLAEDSDTATAWNYVKRLLRECGRSLPALSSIEAVYRIGNLSLQQANQMYYLLKHSLTTEGIDYSLQYSFSLDAAGALPAPIEHKRKRRRRRNKNAWKAVGTSNQINKQSSEEDLSESN